MKPDSGIVGEAVGRGVDDGQRVRIALGVVVVGGEHCVHVAAVRAEDDLGRTVGGRSERRDGRRRIERWRVVYRGDGDGDRGRAARLEPIGGGVGEFICAVVVLVRRIGEGAIGVEGEAAVGALGERVDRQRVVLGIGVVTVTWMTMGVSSLVVAVSSTATGALLTAEATSSARGDGDGVSGVGLNSQPSRPCRWPPSSSLAVMVTVSSPEPVVR